MNRFAYRTTGLAIKAMASLTRANISIHGADRIPEAGDLVSAVETARATRFTGEVGSMVSDPEPKVRRVAVQALRSIGSAEVFPFCATATADRSIKVVTSAIECLEVVGDRRALPRLVILASSENSTVRAAAARALTTFKALTDYPDLAAGLLGDADGMVKSVVLTGLKNHPDPKSVSYLARASRDENPKIRRVSAAALGALRHPGISDPLKRLLSDPDQKVRASAVQAAVGSERADLVEAVSRSSSDPEAAVRTMLALAIGESGDAGWWPVIKKLSADEEEVVAAAALVPAARVGGPRAFPLLKTALQDNSGAVKMQAIRGLAVVGTPEALSLLRKVAAEGALQEKIVTFRELAQLGDRESIPILRKALEHDSRSLRRAARSALDKLR